MTKEYKTIEMSVPIFFISMICAVVFMVFVFWLAGDKTGVKLGVQEEQFTCPFCLQEKHEVPHTLVHPLGIEYKTCAKCYENLEPIFESLKDAFDR